MKFKKAAKLSYRNITRSKLRNSMVILAIILSVILGSVVIGSVNGIKSYWTKSIYDAGFNAMFIVSGKTSMGGSFSPPAKLLNVEDVRGIKNLPNVAAVSPVFIAGVFRFGENVTYLIGVDEDIKISASFSLANGRFLNIEDENDSFIPVVLGYNIWKNFLGGLSKVNYTMNLKFEPFSLAYGKKESLTLTLKVIGILEKRAQIPGLGLDPNSVFYTTLKHAYSIFNISDLRKASVDGAVVSSVKFEDLDSVSDEIMNYLKSKGYSERTDFTVISQKDALRYIQNAFAQVNSFVSIIWVVIIIIASLTVLIVMTITVRERYKEIGTLRALGARKTDVMLLFLLEASYLSLIGIIIGSIVGYIIIEILKQYYAFIRLVDISVILETYSIILPELFIASIAFALYPAYRASSIEPVKALRYE